MIKALKQMAKTSPVRRFYLFPHRFRTAWSYSVRNLKRIPGWMIHSNECDNFNYDLAELNRDYLASFIAVVADSDVAKVRGYFDELLSDTALKDHIARMTLSSEDRYVADQRAKYARRLGWYALVRILKPKLVIETGIDKGLGSCVLAAALLRNVAEGFPGSMIGTDINPRAGYLLNPPYTQVAKVMYGDSITSLQTLPGPIDLFINDSDHSADYEAREYGIIDSKLSKNALIIGDNAHSNNKLMTFALQTNRRFLYFQEKPEGHWYPGAGIGVAFSHPAKEGPR